MDSSETIARSVIQSIRRDSLQLDSGEDASPSHLQLMLQRVLTGLSRELYTKDTHFILELIQNADDNSYKDSIIPTMRIELHHDRIVIRTNETGFTEANVRAICDIGQSTKKSIEGFIGEKGIGFKAVFKVAHVVHVSSGAYRFKFDRDGTLGMVAPIWDPNAVTQTGHTTIILELSDKYRDDQSARARLVEQLESLDPTLLLFLRRLKVVELYFSSNNTTTRLTRSERLDDSHVITSARSAVGWSTSTDYLIVRDAIDMSSIVASERKAIKSSEILLAFPLGDGDLPLRSPQNVHAFLPLRSWGFWFMIQADFLTASSREDVLEDSAWNIRLRKAVCEVFVGMAIGEFHLRPSLKYTWTRFLPEHIPRSFFSAIEDHLMAELQSEDIIFDLNDNLRRPVKIIIPQAKHYNMENLPGSPLVPQSYLGDHSFYISPSYAKSDYASLRRLGVRDMTDLDFLGALQSMDNSSALQRQSPSWLMRVCSQLLVLMNNAQFRSRIKALRLMPIDTGPWLSARHADEYVFDLGDTGSIPAHLDLGRISRSVAPLSSHYSLLERLGVKPANPQVIADKILASQSLRTLDERMQDALFLFHHRASISYPTNFSKLVLVDERFRDCSSAEMYIDLPQDKCRLRNALPSSARFLHSRYMCPFEDIKTRAEWFLWLVHAVGISHFPKLVNGRASAEFKGMAALLTPETFLETLAYFWHRIPHHPLSLWRDDLAEVSVVVNDTLTRLEETFLRRPLLAKHVIPSLPFLPVKDPENTRWDFLKSLGVSADADVQFFTKLLLQMSQPGSTDRNAILLVYQQIAARFDENPSVIRTAFTSHAVYFAPENLALRGQGEWLSNSRVYWDCPQSLTSFFALSSFYGVHGLKHFFVQSLGIRNAPASLLVSELQTFASEHSRTVLSEDQWDHATSLLLDIETSLRASEDKNVIGAHINAVRRMAASEAIFPARIKATGIELRSLGEIYLRDKADYYATSFEDHVAFLDLNTSHRSSSSIRRTLQLVPDAVRNIGDCVKVSTSINGTSEPFTDMTATLLSRQAFFEREYKYKYDKASRKKPELEFLEKLKSANAFLVDDVETTLTLDGIAVQTTGRFHLKESEFKLDFYFAQGSDHSSRMRPFFDTLATRTSLPRDAIKALTFAPIDYLENDDAYYDGMEDEEDVCARDTSWLGALPAQTPVSTRPTVYAAAVRRAKPSRSSLDTTSSTSSTLTLVGNHRQSVTQTVHSISSTWALTGFAGRRSVPGPLPGPDSTFGAQLSSSHSLRSSNAYAGSDEGDRLSSSATTIRVSTPNPHSFTPQNQTVNGILGELYVSCSLSFPSEMV
ncbi:hypothetical protein HGRIS_007177 [Hohenbuehelia grisea]|uniref:Uncharacterized protein n=1 Tax=Hohenbuehelia grisea TaxID=104357 RepID=A0ABR3JBA3_9AGAR